MPRQTANAASFSALKSSAAASAASMAAPTPAFSPVSTSLFELEEFAPRSPKDNQYPGKCLYRILPIGCGITDILALCPEISESDAKIVIISAVSSADKVVCVAKASALSPGG